MRPGTTYSRRGEISNRDDSSSESVHPQGATSFSGASLTVCASLKGSAALAMRLRNLPNLETRSTLILSGPLSGRFRRIPFHEGRIGDSMCGLPWYLPAVVKINRNVRGEQIKVVPTPKTFDEGRIGDVSRCFPNHCT